MVKKSATTCENGKSGCVGSEGGGAGWEGARMMHSLHCSLWAVRSALSPGLNTDFSNGSLMLLAKFGSIWDDRIGTGAGVCLFDFVSRNCKVLFVGVWPCVWGTVGSMP